jgi:hypothetical protein
MSALALNQDGIEKVTEVERQFQSVKVNMFGRYMLENKREFPCQIDEMSPGTAKMSGPQAGEVGERVIAYMDHVGRLEGKVLRTYPGGFAMSINATPQKRDRLAAKITWVANRHELSLPEDRRHERVTPTTKLAEIKLEDQRTYSARIIDLSLSGAAVEMEVRPAIGTLIWIGNMRGRVVRHFDDGVALEFAILQTHDTLQDYIQH